MTTADSLYERLIAAEAGIKHDPFWAEVDRKLDLIEASKPDTAAAVLAALGSTERTGFFEGSGGDRQLLDSLLLAGWKVSEYEAIYFWTAKHPRTASTLEYIEGDVYSRDT